MSASAVKTAIDTGDVSALSHLLSKSLALANEKILWGPANRNKTDPLHYIADCVAAGRLQDGVDVALAELLLNHGALIDGVQGAETPLIGATSLAAGDLANHLVARGADVHPVSIHGATALHWACYTGLPDVVKNLISHGALIEQKCADFQSTPLFWGVHSIRYGTDKAHHQTIAAIIHAIKVLLDAGADRDAVNFQGYSAKQLAIDTGNDALIALLN